MFYILHEKQLLDNFLRDILKEKLKANKKTSKIFLKALSVKLLM